MLSPADLHPANRTPPHLLAKAWEVKWQMVGPGDDLPPAPVNSAAVLIAADDPQGLGHGTGPGGFSEELIGYVRSAVMIIVVSGPGSGFFHTSLIAKARKYKRCAILISSNVRYHNEWSDIVRREAPNALIAEHDPIRNFWIVNEPQALPESEW
ncbi:hypothetical protein JL101_036270 (plasmid) [Skermanella rosea]|uniref:hypothetical protein n=1 Tax=Skermanella rosea TaxID=1817965 RepID=UPI0019316FBC|nr:hypothetical protein [Skermanella rosea]UEM08152.1 hypothetical protein JL101_036270 [Skermanella rosea]